MQASLSFRPLERFDFPLLQEWLAAPQVAAWWNERNDMAGVEAKYGPRVHEGWLLRGEHGSTGQ